MLDWNDSRPLKSGPGHALALELVDQPTTTAYTLVLSALESLADLGTPQPYARPGSVEFMLVGYLRGLAAAAIVADIANGTEEWTSARDYALHGRRAEFLPPDTVLLGTLTMAMTAVGRAMELLPVWESHAVAPPVPGGHRAVVEQIQRALAQATQARMDQVSDRAEDVSGA